MKRSDDLLCPTKTGFLQAKHFLRFRGNSSKRNNNPASGNNRLETRAVAKGIFLLGCSYGANSEKMEHPPSRGEARLVGGMAEKMVQRG